MTVVLLLAHGRFDISLSGQPVADPRTTLTPRGLRLRVSPGVGRVTQIPREPLPCGLAGHSERRTDVCPRDLAVAEHLDPHQ